MIEWKPISICVTPRENSSSQGGSYLTLRIVELIYRVLPTALKAEADDWANPLVAPMVSLVAELLTITAIELNRLPEEEALANAIGIRGSHTLKTSDQYSAIYFEFSMKILSFTYLPIESFLVIRIGK